MSAKENQNLTEPEELESLIDELNATGEGAEDIADLTQGDRGERDKNAKIAHSFALAKQRNKAAAALLEKQQKELIELKRFKEDKERGSVGEGGTMTSPPPVGAPVVNQAGNVLEALTIRAMQNLGIFRITNPEQQEIVRMERDRLYFKQASNIEEEARAKGRAPAIIEEELSAFPQLDDSDKEVIKERLGNYGVLQQTDKSVIKREVTLYLGEQSLVGGSTRHDLEVEEGELSPAPRNEEKVSSSVAAAAAVKSGRSGVGVKPGVGEKKKGPSPATPEELSQMRKLSMTDLNAFREAQKRKEHYKGR